MCLGPVYFGTILPKVNLQFFLRGNLSSVVGSQSPRTWKKNESEDSFPPLSGPEGDSGVVVPPE